jgi:signal transduction histidine kinase
MDESGPATPGGSGLRSRLTVWITLISVIGTALLAAAATRYLREREEHRSAIVLVEAIQTWRSAGAARPAPSGTGLDVLAPGDIAPSRRAIAGEILATGTPISARTAWPGDLRIAYGSADATPAAWLAAEAIDADTGEAWIALQDAAPLVRAVDATHRTALVLVPLAAVASAVAAWFVAGIAVAPIRALRRAAEGIRPTSVDQPIEVMSEDAPLEAQRLQSALNDALARVDAGYRGQERFLLNVSHEIKTPISVVLSEAEVRLASPDAGEPERRVLRHVVDEMRRLGSLVESFLILARVRHGDQPRRRRPIGLDELIAESADACAGLTRRTGIRLRLDLDASAEDADATVEGDPDLLRTMLDNLVRNAIRFSPPGGTVVIRAAIADAAAELSVTDAGPGIPDELLPRLFDRFSQADEERRGERGTGLGLAIAAGVAELHGGTVTAENQAVGCRLTVRLPLASP